jgi:hypothetical protein
MASLTPLHRPLFPLFESMAHPCSIQNTLLCTHNFHCR